jgi:hypothetical protein
VLSPDAFDILRSAFEDDRLNIGCFRSRFAGEGVLLRCYSFFTRFESVFTSFGDQGIVVRKDFYRLLGGFPDWPLFEDVQFLRLARRRTAIRKFQAEATTSGRRFTANGALRQQLRNFFLLMQFLGGRSPNELAFKYPRQGAHPEKRLPGIPVPSSNGKGQIFAGHITGTTAPRGSTSLTNTETHQ